MYTAVLLSLHNLNPNHGISITIEIMVPALSRNSTLRIRLVQRGVSSLSQFIDFVFIRRQVRRRPIFKGGSHRVSRSHQLPPLSPSHGPSWITHFPELVDCHGSRWFPARCYPVGAAIRLGHDSLGWIRHTSLSIYFRLISSLKLDQSTSAPPAE